MQQQQKDNTHKTQRARFCTISDDLLCSVHGNALYKSQY